LTAQLDRDSPITVALVYARVAVAGPQGVLQATLARELKLPESVVTRAVQALSRGNPANQRPGLELIAQTFDSADSRHRVLRLTEKGIALALSLEAPLLH